MNRNKEIVKVSIYGIFNYDKLFPDAKEIYSILKDIQSNNKIR